MSRFNELGRKELEILEQFSRINPIITPAQFRYRWNAKYAVIAQICQVTPGSVKRWFARGTQHRNPSTLACWKLTLADRILRYASQIPPGVLQQLLADENEEM